MIRRILLGSITSKISTAFSTGIKGLMGEVFDSEVYELYGFSARPPKSTRLRSLLFQINGSNDNHVAFHPRGTRQADDDTTLIYFDEDNEITVSKNCVMIRVNSGFFSIKDGKVTTDLDIETTGVLTALDVKTASGVSLSTHTHTSPSGPTGPAQPG